MKKIDLKKTFKEKLNKIKKTYNFGLFEIIVLVIICGFSVLLFGYFVKSTDKEDVSYKNPTISKEIQKFIEEYNYILNNYYGEIDKEELIKEAIKGMMSSLDEHSEFIGDESNNFEITLQGYYKGVGIGISNDTNGNIIITQIYPNTPAEKAGLKYGDIITKFNDMTLENKTTSELVDMISKNNKIKLNIKRGKKDLEVELKKENIVLDSVLYEMKENNIGYIQVSIFASNTDEQFKNALNNLEKQGMEKLIIDLRGNTGGHLTTVENMLYEFLDSSHIIYQTESKEGIKKYYSKGSVDKKYPIVILQNSTSASASEIMAATLKEELNAYIIGNKSYGKGTVQQLQSVEGIGDYKFTTKKWLTPNGNWIHEVGIIPDLEVSLDLKYLQNPGFDTDNQYQEAIKYLKDLD